jgi:uncharacterized protein (DUF362 family)
MPEKSSRREFLKKSAIAGLSLTSIGAAARLAQSAQPAAKARLVMVRDNAAAGADGAYNAAVIDEMLRDAMLRLTGKPTVAEAWKQYVTPDDVVGLKVNCLFGLGASTHPEVTYAVVNGLQAAGVKADNIIIWDATTRHLITGGYQPNADAAGVKCYGTDNQFDAGTTEFGSFKGRMSRILSERITALVNIPILKDHGISGMTFAIKNHLGSINNPGAQHPNHCDPYIADLNAVPLIMAKTRLIVGDVVRPIANGGPGYNARFAWQYGGLLVGADPVAMDQVGWQTIEARRAEIGLPTLKAAGREPTWIASAAQRGVGTNDPNQIELVNFIR